MKTYGRVDVEICDFSTTRLVEGESSVSRPSHFTLGENAPTTYWIEGFLDTRAGLDDMEKQNYLTIPGLELRFPILLKGITFKKFYVKTCCT
jgi:hypothetical protein